MNPQSTIVRAVQSNPVYPPRSTPALRLKRTGAADKRFSLDAADDHVSPDALSLTEYSQEGISGSMTKCPQFRTYACSDGVLPEESSDGAGTNPSRGGFRSLDRGTILDKTPGTAELQPK